MAREKVKETVIEFISNIIDDSDVQITEESGLMEDLDLSSLEIMTLIADIEKEFHIIFEEADFRKIIFVGELIQCIQNKLREE